MAKKDPTPVTLEKLLQLKRNERPPQEFWDSFDKELHARRLRELVERPSPWARMLKSWRQAAYVFAPVAAAASLAFVFLANSERVAETGSPTVGSLAVDLDFLQTSALEFVKTGVREEVASADVVGFELPARSRFVVEALSMPSERAHYSRVLYTPSMTSSSWEGAVHYVAEPIAEAASRSGSGTPVRLRHF